jgi:metal-responsive CopG/Arc/MetJ family transcriptional regulator
VELELPEDVLKDVDDVGRQFDFKTRDSFVIAAMRRLVDKYKILLSH